MNFEFNDDILLENNNKTRNFPVKLEYDCYKCHLCDNNASNFNVSPYTILLPWCSKCYSNNIINIYQLSKNEKICHTCAVLNNRTVLSKNDMIPVGACLVSCINCINKYGIEKNNKEWKKYDSMEKHVFQKRFVDSYSSPKALKHCYKQKHSLYQGANNFDDIQKQLLYSTYNKFMQFQQYNHPELQHK